MRLITSGGLKLEATSFQRNKPLLLLAYLCLQGPQERRHIAELFWPRSQHARRNLTTVLSRLRKIGPGVIGSDGRMLWSPLECDAVTLIEASHKGQDAELVALYQGAFLKGLELRLGVELEEWLFATRERLAKKYRRGLIHLAETARGHGDLEHTLALAERAYRLVAAPELLQPEAGQLYQLLLACNSDDAEQLSTQLQQEDVLLSDAVRVDTARAVAAKAAPHNLPARGHSFVGREADIREIMGLLKQDDCRLLSLVGVGGIGKTRLSLEVARCILSEQPPADGLFFVPLEGLSNADVVPTAIANTLGIALLGQDARQRVKRFLAKKQLLLILDNAEHLIASRDFIADLINSSVQLKILVTSRQLLSLGREWVFELKGLTYPETSSAPLSLEQARYYDAIQLFERRNRQMNRSYHLDQEQLQAVIQLCQLVEGMPLALELAASWHGLYTPTELVEALESNLGVLSATTYDKSQRHSSIEAVFDHSWRLLSAEEQRVLSELAVFRGGFSRDAAIAVTSATVVVLKWLIDQSLVQTSLTGRMLLHPLLWQYAQAKQRQGAGVEEKHSHYFCHFLKQHEEGLQSLEARQHREAVATEIDNIRAAWDYAVQQQREDLLNSAYYALTWYFLGKSQLQEPQEFYTSAASSFEYGTVIHARMLREKAKFLKLANQFEACNEILSYCLDVFKQHRLSWDEAMCLHWIGLATLDVEQRRSLYLQAARRFRDSGDLRESAWIINYCAGMAHDPAQRERLHLESLRAFQNAPSFGVTGTLSSLGLHLAQTKGCYQEAQLFVDEALRITRNQGNDFRMLHELNACGHVLLMSGHLADAESKVREVLHIVSQLEPDFVSRTLHGYLVLAGIHRLRGNSQAAVDCYGQAQGIVKRVVRDISSDVEVRIKLGVATIHLQHQNPGKALKLCENVLSDLESSPDALVSIEVLNLHAQITLALGYTSQAEQYLTQATRLAEKGAFLPAYLDLLVTLAQVKRQADQPTEALDVLHCVHSHPASMFESRQRAQELIRQDHDREALSEPGRKLDHLFEAFHYSFTPVDYLDQFVPFRAVVGTYYHMGVNAGPFTLLREPDHP